MVDKVITRADVEHSARKLIGAPFMHQGRSPASGIDCIGTVIATALDVGYISKRDLLKLDRHDYKRTPDAYQTMVAGIAQITDEIPIETVKGGDIMSFRMPSEEESSHVGIVVRGRQELMLVHALYGKVTVEVPLRQWYKYATHAFRLRGISE